MSRWQKVAPVRGRVEEHVRRTAFDASLEHRLEGLVRRVAGVERKVVAKDDEPIRRVAHEAHERGQALDVLAMDLDQLEAPGDILLAVDRGMGGLDQRRFAHAPRAPKKRIVGRQAAGEALRILDQKVAHPIDPAQERKVDAVDALNRRERAAVSAPDEGLGRFEIGFRRMRGREAIEGVGDAAQEGVGRIRRRQDKGIRLETRSSLCHSDG